MLFALGFIAGILLCMFCASIIKRTDVVERVLDRVIDPKPPEERGTIVELAEVERIKKTREGVSLDDAFDELHGEE